MWKFIMVAVIFVDLGVGQKSFYAPRSGSYPKLLSRFKTTDTTSTTEQTLERRNEYEDLDFSNFSPQEGLHEKDFFERVSKWPQERQPFWFKNRKVISSARGVNVDGDNTKRSFKTTEGSTQDFKRPFQDREVIIQELCRLNGFSMGGDRDFLGRPNSETLTKE